MKKIKDLLPLLIVLLIVVGLIIYSFLINKVEYVIFGFSVAIGSFILRKIFRK